MAYARVLLGLLISVVCIGALLSQIDLQLTWLALTRAQPLWLLAALAVLLATMYTKAYRWGLLYYPTTGLRLGNLMSALYVGYMVSAVVPMRLGELVRAYLIGKTEPVTFTQSVGTVLVEKILDVITILGFLAVLGLLVPLPALAVPGPLLAALGLGGVAFLFVLAWLPREPLLAALARLQLHLPGSRRWNLVNLVGPFLEALGVLRYGRLLGPLAFWSLLNWSLSTTINYCVMLALDVPAPAAAAVFLTVVTNLGMIVPSAPGYVGVFHYLAVLAMTAFGVEPSHAAGYAVVLHALVYGTFIVGGLYYTWRGGYRLADLWPGRGPGATADAVPAPSEPLVVAAPEGRVSAAVDR